MSMLRHPVTLSQAGFALVFLEGQIAEEMRAIQRWAARELEAKENRLKAQSILSAHLARVQSIKKGL